MNKTLIGEYDSDNHKSSTQRSAKLKNWQWFIDQRQRRMTLFSVEKFLILQ